MRLRTIVRWGVVASFSACLSVAMCGESDKTDANGKKPFRVYFIGHSLYHYGKLNIPAAVQYFSEVGNVDRPIQAFTFIKGGAKHQDYLNSPEVMKRLQEEPWDMVVIAGNLNDMANPEKVNLDYAVKLDNEVKSKNARLFEYVAWPWVKVSGEQIFEKRAQAQDAFNHSLLRLSKETGATLVPSGPGLVNVIRKDLKYMDDMKYGEVHVSPLGYYFTACVIFATIYNKSPEGLPSTFMEFKIDPDKAKVLQTTAWETVQEWQKLQSGNSTTQPKSYP